jgi:peptidoglycan/LPS O-acetylase OafA/YrhL
MSTATLIHLEAPATTRRRHYPGLDGLRGIAILAVFLSHYSGGHTAGNSVAHFVAGVLDAGWMGVDLFFVLSGFLITGILLDTADAPHKVLNFYARRALRIFPIFYGVLFVFLLLTPVLHLRWLPQHLLYFFYLSNMFPLLIRHVIPPGWGVDLVHFWSLAVEEQFYLVWPLVVWRVTDRKLLFRIAVGIMVVAFLLRVTLVFKGIDASVIYQLLPTRADSLICGSLLALAVRWANGQQLPLTLVFIGSGVGVLLVFWASGSTLHNSALISTAGYTLIALFFSCVVYYAQQESSWVRKVSDRSILRFFGRYSYGLYIYHGVLLVFLVPLLGLLQAATHSLIVGGACFVLLSFGISLAVSMLSYHYIEHPILRYKRNFA